MKPEINVPDFSKLINPTFQALKALGGSGNTDEIYEKVIELEGFSDELLSVIHKNSNQSEIAYRIAWARTYLKKFGAIENTSRGVWVINNDFENSQTFNAKELIQQVRNGYDASTCHNKTDITAGNDADCSPETETWKTELKHILRDMDPFEFEKLSQLLLREAGFSQVTVTKKTGDGGIDGFGKFTINGIISFKLAFQCKRYVGSVPSKEIRNFRGSMTADVEKGLFITTGSFTRDAIKEATANGKKHIDLIDGEQLLDKLATLRLGVKEEKQYVVDHEFFDKFS